MRVSVDSLGTKSTIERVLTSPYSFPSGFYFNYCMLESGVKNRFDVWPSDLKRRDG